MGVDGLLLFRSWSARTILFVNRDCVILFAYQFVLFIIIIIIIIIVVVGVVIVIVIIIVC